VPRRALGERRELKTWRHAGFHFVNVLTRVVKA
jgi:hypothetical protein